METQYIIRIDKPFSGSPETILKDGNPAYVKETSFQEYAANRLNEKLVVVTDKEFFTALDAYLNVLCNTWHEISEEEYFYALEVLPPMRYNPPHFMMSEFTTYDVTGFFTKPGSRFYTSQQRTTYKLDDVLSNLKKAIQQNRIEV